jgi:hypothetical protein
MDPDMFLTIAFVLYAVVVATGTGLLIARSGRHSVIDQAIENRLNGSISTARPTCGETAVRRSPTLGKM